jgi:hypothetical protein
MIKPMNEYDCRESGSRIGRRAPQSGPKIQGIKAKRDDLAEHAKIDSLDHQQQDVAPRGQLLYIGAIGAVSRLIPKQHIGKRGQNGRSQNKQS